MARHHVVLIMAAGLIAGGCHRAPSSSGPGDKREEIPKAQAAPATEQAVKALAEFNRGTALLEQYDYPGAVKQLESVVAALPAWTAARFNLGLALLNLPDSADSHDRAEVELKKVIEADPGHPWAHFCLGVLYYHNGEFPQAQEHFGKVHASDPDDPFVAFEYAETLRKLDRNDEALKLLEGVVERDPGFVSAFYSLGMLYNRTRQRDKAVQTLKRFAELKPQELAVGSFGVVSPYAGMGKYYTALGADGSPVPPSSMSPSPRVLFSPAVKTIECPLRRGPGPVAR